MATPGDDAPAAALDFSPEERARWEWPADEVRRVGHQVVELIAAHLSSLPGRPVFRPFPAELAEAMTAPQSAPIEGADPASILAEFAETVEPYPFGNGHPRFHGWVNSPPAVLGVFAEALAAAMNPSVAGGNHAAVFVERQVLEWLKALAAFPPESMGLLVSGGSMATLTALAVARTAAARRDGVDVRAAGVAGLPRPLAVYTSPEGHAAIRKSVELLGIGSERLRIVAADGERRMRPDELDRALRRDLADGLRPMAVVASAGSAGTGAVDPLAELAAVCRAHGVWLHVDGAYGLPAILTERWRAALEPVALADSVALDPHKWLYVPVEAGAVLVRDADAMRGTFSLVPAYLQTDPAVGGGPWLSEYGFAQTRGFRALKVWMALKHHGLEGYRRAIARDVALAEHLAARVEESPELQLASCSLSIVCFRYAPPELAADPERADALNRRLLREVQLGGEAFLTSTAASGRYVLRACIINPRATREGVEALVRLVERTGRRLMEG
ncbi:MAG TPA: pyridoxal-dependent decarboxylase [Longimicrobium sp.]|jgi:glutamate/tyrosine decarboxylase-like PLP-dependent enzyme